jgi:hypothetical protein
MNADSLPAHLSDKEMPVRVATHAESAHHVESVREMGDEQDSQAHTLSIVREKLPQAIHLFTILLRHAGMKLFQFEE